MPHMRQHINHKLVTLHAYSACSLHLLRQLQLFLDRDHLLAVHSQHNTRFNIVWYHLFEVVAFGHVCKLQWNSGTDVCQWSVSSSSSFAKQ